MGRVALIIGGVIGCIVVVLGVLFLILAVTQPDANQSDEIVGFGIFTGIGLVVAIPCLFFAYRMTPPVAAGMRFGAANLPPAAADAETRYLQWFTWCQQAIGGDPISLHAATMAALRAPDNPTAAASAEASRQASRIGASGPMPPPPRSRRWPASARRPWAFSNPLNVSWFRSWARTGLVAPWRWGRLLGRSVRPSPPAGAGRCS